LEIKKDRVYKKDYRTTGIVIYSTLSNREQIDTNLQMLKVGNSKNFKYIFFYYTSLNIKLYSLHINKINNVNMKYELLQNIDIIDKVAINNKKYTLHDVLLEVKSIALDYLLVLNRA
jgi:hypothetical protein